MKLKSRKIVSVILLTVLCLTQAGAFFAYADPVTEAAQESAGDASAEQNSLADDASAAESDPVSDLSWPGLGADIKAGSAIVMDADTHQILWGKDIHAKRYPASITKILTALIVIDRCAMDEQVTFSAAAVNNLESGAVTIGTVPGDVLSVKDCLYALLLKSANEVANALAEHVSGSISDFAGLMNLYAAELGCVDSDFKNPSGLTNPNHVTSAYDMALIACACMNNRDFMYLESEPTRKLAGTIKYPDGLTVTIGHKMRKEGEEYYDPRVTAGKTGFTSAAGNTLVTMAEDHGRRIVVVVLKDTTPAHYTDTASLINYGLDEFELLEPSFDVLDETFDLEKQLVEKGLIQPSDEETGAENRLSLSSVPSIVVPAGGGIADLKVNLDGKVFAGSAEDEFSQSDVPENAVAKLTLSCLDSNGRTVYVLNDRTEAESENSEIALLGGSKKKSDPGEPGTEEKKGLNAAGWIVIILLLTAVGYVGYLYLRKRSAEKRREERRRKRLERMDRIDAKETAAHGSHRRTSRPAPASSARPEEVTRTLDALGRENSQQGRSLLDENGQQGRSFGQQGTSLLDENGQQGTSLLDENSQEGTSPLTEKEDRDV